MQYQGNEVQELDISTLPRNEQGIPYVNVLSYGAGRQTFGMLVKYAKKYKFCVFADTGGESKETYEHINKVVIPFCKANGIQFVRIYQDQYGKLLYEYCWDKHIVPSIYFRDCTYKFKILAMRKFYRRALKADRRMLLIHQDIGFSWDEVERMDNALANKKKPQYIKDFYPLCDDRITADELIAFITQSHYPVPPKSGCWFCPFTQRARFIAMKNSEDSEQRQHYEDSCRLEENNSRFPEILLRGMGQRKTKSGRPSKAKTMKPLRMIEDDDESFDRCKSGFCFV